LFFISRNREHIFFEKNKIIFFFFLSCQSLPEQKAGFCPVFGTGELAPKG